MAIQKKEVEYAKETDDALVLAIAIVKDAKAGKPIGEIASGNLQKLIDAFAGGDQIPVEAAQARKVVLQTVGFRTGELADAFLPQSAEPAPGEGDPL